MTEEEAPDLMTALKASLDAVRAGGDDQSAEPDERGSDSEDDRVYIAEMASIIGRYEHTVRRWVREAEKVFGYAGFVPDDQGLLPQEHWPEREPEGRKRLYWRNDQVEQMKSFAQMKESRRGWHGASRS